MRKSLPGLASRPARDFFVLESYPVCLRSHFACTSHRSYNIGVKFCFLFSISAEMMTEKEGRTIC